MMKTSLFTLLIVFFSTISYSASIPPSIMAAPMISTVITSNVAIATSMTMKRKLSYYYGWLNTCGYINNKEIAREFSKKYGISFERQDIRSSILLGNDSGFTKGCEQKDIKHSLKDEPDWIKDEIESLIDN